MQACAWFAGRHVVLARMQCSRVALGRYADVCLVHHRPVLTAAITYQDAFGSEIQREVIERQDVGRSIGELELVEAQYLAVAALRSPPDPEWEPRDLDPL